jgi:hypothetical protein
MTPVSAWETPILIPDYLRYFSQRVHRGVRNNCRARPFSRPTDAKRPFWPNFLEVHFGSCPSHPAEALRTTLIRKPIPLGFATLHPGVLFRGDVLGSQASLIRVTGFPGDGF